MKETDPNVVDHSAILRCSACGLGHVGGIEGHDFSADLYKRLSALEHDAFEHDARLEAIEAVQGEQKSKPLSCCEGCSEIPCHKPLGELVVGHKPSCYREKKTCSTCKHALELDRYDDILCLRASVWQHPRFEYSYSTGCEYHYERESC